MASRAARQRTIDRKPLMTEPTLVTIAEKTVIGIGIRTTNVAELHSETAMIPAAWRLFFQRRDSVGGKTDPDVILAVYTHYASDHAGEYSLFVSSQVSVPTDVPEGMTALTISAGAYLVFAARGPMPAALIDAWRRVWDYFGRCSAHERAYTTDFELHDTRQEGRAEVYIAMK